MDKLMIQIFSMEGAALHWYKMQPPQALPTLGLAVDDDDDDGEAVPA